MNQTEELQQKPRVPQARTLSAEERPGYKKTKLGWIPEEWEVISLGDQVDYVKGFAFKSENYTPHGLRIIKVSDMDFSSIHDNSPTYVDPITAEKYRKWQLRDGDLLFTTVGSRPPLYDSMVGKVVRVREEHEGCLLNQNAVKITGKDAFCSNSFLVNHFKTKRYIYFIETIARGNANQASITLKDLWQFTIPLPPLPEQIFIARILSTWDKAIDTLQKLIAKKQERKKGLMQALLTGKMRFEGFDVEWKEVKLGGVCNMQAGKFVRASEIKEKCADDLFPCYGGNGLRGFTKSYTHSGKYSLIGRQGALCGNVNLVVGQFHATEHAVVVTPEGSAETDWLYYVLIRLNLNQYATGQAQPGLSVANLEMVELKIPKNRNEQQKIASVLSAADREIEKLQGHLEKLQDQKQGLMQKLLTGEVRVKI